MMAQRVISVKVTGEKTIKDNVSMLRRFFPDWLNEANLETAQTILDEARNNVKQLDAFDTGALFNSLQLNVSPKGLSVTVFSTSKHAPFIEFGTAPHWPPMAPIRAWCARKGLPESAAFLVARAISERGTPERPFLTPAYKVGIRQHIDRIRKFVGAGFRKLG
jgi:hypothetical protein